MIRFLYSFVPATCSKIYVPLAYDLLVSAFQLFIVHCALSQCDVFTMQVILSGWRCKSYGHRTGDRECPMFISGNKDIEKFRMVRL